MDGFGRAESEGWAADDVGGAFGTTTVTSETFLAFLGRTGSVTSMTTIVESIGDDSDKRRDKCRIVVAGVVYPVLKGLKITLPENASALVSSWDMPNLQTPTIALTPATSPAPPSSPSSSPSPFHCFFQTHGKTLVQLKLSSPITPTQSSNPHHKDDDEAELPLSKIYPNFKSLIFNCGTGGEEVEWDWENPNWASPSSWEGVVLRSPSLTLAAWC
ncbi:hypothetical protein AAF712_015919 [Marasmius tenuissimus]|uniref:Uncharacterized protein n=1 Tax=Marasmius tenuissimus TaxID=585030 RepID=A0ABR2Z9J3_9AGAR